MLKNRFLSFILCIGLIAPSIASARSELDTLVDQVAPTLTSLWNGTKETFQFIEPYQQALVNNPTTTLGKTFIGGMAAYYAWKGLKHGSTWLKGENPRLAEVASHLAATSLSIYLATHIGGPVFKDSAKLTLFMTILAPSLIELLKSSVFGIASSLDPLASSREQEMRAEIDKGYKTAPGYISRFMMPPDITLNDLREMNCKHGNNGRLLDENINQLLSFINAVEHGETPALLLAGPSGTGKTFFLQDLANLLAVNYIYLENTKNAVNTGGYKDLGADRWKALKNQLDLMWDLGQLKAGDIVAFDELDALIRKATEHDDTTDANKGAMQALDWCRDHGVIFVGITNLVDQNLIVDTFLNRFKRTGGSNAAANSTTTNSGGFVVTKELPDEYARRAIIHRNFATFNGAENIELNEAFIQSLATVTEKLTASAVTRACTDLIKKWAPYASLLGKFNINATNQLTKKASLHLYNQILGNCAQQAMEELQKNYNQMLNGEKSAEARAQYDEDGNPRTISQEFKKKLEQYKRMQEGRLLELQTNIHEIRTTGENYTKQYWEAEIEELVATRGTYIQENRIGEYQAKIQALLDGPPGSDGKGGLNAFINDCVASWTVAERKHLEQHREIKREQCVNSVSATSPNVAVLRRKKELLEEAVRNRTNLAIARERLYLAGIVAKGANNVADDLLNEPNTTRLNQAITQLGERITLGSVEHESADIAAREYEELANKYKALAARDRERIRWATVTRATFNQLIANIQDVQPHTITITKTTDYGRTVRTYTLPVSAKEHAEFMSLQKQLVEERAMREGVFLTDNQNLIREFIRQNNQWTPEAYNQFYHEQFAHFQNQIDCRALQKAIVNKIAATRRQIHILVQAGRTDPGSVKEADQVAQKAELFFLKSLNDKIIKKCELTKEEIVRKRKISKTLTALRSTTYNKQAAAAS